MRKIAILAAFAAVAGATAVQAQSGAPADRPRPEGRGPGGPGGRGGPGGFDRVLLQGITLSDAQQAQLKTLRETERAQMQANGGQARGNFEAIRDAREKGDTATARRLMQEERAQMDARRDQQMSAIRAILTNDQVAQFEANVAEMKKREAEMGAGGPGGRGRGPRPPQR